MTILYYIHDPMCSWCWGFKPVWIALQKNLSPTITVKYLLGGLAKDSDKIMPISLQSTIQQTWHTIEQEMPGITFNFDFWAENKPRRSTYPACRAVISARNQGAHYKMIDGIQRAYYINAKNPSDLNVLIQCAKDIGLNMDSFTHDLSSNETAATLNEEIELSRKLGIQGFPSLLLKHNEKDYFIELDYNCADSMLNDIETILKTNDNATSTLS